MLIRRQLKNIRFGKGAIKMKEEDFETKMQALEKIVSDLEKGDLNLDESVKKFEEGMKISKECSKMLEKTEKRITILLNDEDEVVEEEFRTE